MVVEEAESDRRIQLCGFSLFNKALKGWAPEFFDL
jgi:hypothetical protein